MSVEYDPFTHRIHENPYSVYRALRDEEPTYHNERRGFWALSRFEDVQAAARDWKAYSNAEGVDLDATGQQYAAGNFLDADPPEHDMLRGVLRSHFVPKAIAALERDVHDETVAILEALAEREEADLIEEFAARLPVAMICRLLGVPASDRGAVRRWTRGELTRVCEDPALPEVATAAVAEMHAYFAEHVAERRRSGAGAAADLVTSIVAALDEGRIDQDEAVGMCLLIVTAGTETTTAMLGNSLLALDAQRDQRELLRSGAVAEAPAVEELLRYESPIQMLARVASRDVELHGRTIPQGARVVLVYAAANRDERRWPDADRLRLDREPLRNLAFGEGIHHCLGAPLARLEGRVGLKLFLERFPDYEVTGRPAYHHKSNARGLSRLPAALGAPVAAPA